MRKNQHTVGLIRVITSSSQDFINLHGAIIEKHFPQLKVISRCIPDQPTGIHDAATMAQAEPKILQVAQEMADDGVEAVIISCMADPGVELCRRYLHLPIIGAGSAASALCLALGRKIGALGITPQVLEPVERCLGANLIGYLQPVGVHNSLDLLTPIGLAATLQAAWELKDQGVEVILLSCTGMASAGLAAEIRRTVNLPVVDPVVASGLMAYCTLINCNVEGAEIGV